MKSLRLILTHPKFFAPAWVFASLNLWFGTWVIYIPWVKEYLGIDKAQLGFALFFLSFGVFAAFPLASPVITKIGVGRATWWGVILCSLTAMIPLLAGSLGILMLGLFLFGASNGFLDIAMNTLVTEIEREEKKQFMSASHGFFSLGGVLAGLGSFAIPAIDNAPLHMGIVVAIVLLINLYFRKHYIHIAAIPAKKEPFRFSLFKTLFALALISFIAMGSEGAIIDWSGLYLKEIAKAPEILFGAGFLIFSIMMTLGRFLGDGISSRIGSIKSVILGILIALGGYALVLTGVTMISIIGFGLAGLGFSVIVPEMFRIGGNIKGVISSQGIAFIAGSGYAGFLLTPPLLGYISEKTSLVSAFIILCIAAFVALVFGLMLKQKRPQ